MKKIIVSIGKFILLKHIYPWQYRKYASKPVEEGKVIFLEVRNEKISSSLKTIYDKISQDKKYIVKKHFLMEGAASRRENIRRTMEFLKDMGTAEFVFLCEANNAFACFDKREETKVAQLWHGCGAFKKFGFSTADLKFGSGRAQQEKYPLYNNLDVVTVSSPEVVWAYKEAMGLDENVIKPLGVSRTDVFFDSDRIEAAKRKLEEAIPQMKNKKAILYAPTFRGGVAGADAPDKLDVDFMRKRLEAEYVLLIKHHPFVRKPHAIPDSCANFAFDVTRQLETEDLICASDICITDYSSIVFEYALLKKPIIFFAYDIADYYDERGFYYDYETMTPGPIAYNTDELIDAVEDRTENFKAYEMEDFLHKFMEACDGRSTERILKYMGMD